MGCGSRTVLQSILWGCEVGLCYKVSSEVVKITGMTPSTLIIHIKVLESACWPCPSCLDGSLYKEETKTPKLQLWDLRALGITHQLQYFYHQHRYHHHHVYAKQPATLDMFPICAIIQGNVENRCWPSPTLDAHFQSYTYVSITHNSTIKFKTGKIDKISCYLLHQEKHLT